jgi:hypothetical protein
MADRIIHKRSLTEGSVPTTSSLELGELAINVADGKPYIRRSGSVGDIIVPLVSANTITTGSIQVTAGFTGSLLGTSSWAINALTASYINPLNQNVIITGSLIQGLAGNIASGTGSHAEGYFTIASGSFSHAEGSGSIASGIGSHAEGEFTIASGGYSHAEGIGTSASEFYSHAEGYGSIALGVASHAEGIFTSALGHVSHAEGYFTTASGDYSHAEGANTITLEFYSHAEGTGSIASGIASHAEGHTTLASGSYSHAEGYNTISSGSYAHAEGDSTQAIGIASHAEGTGSLALGDASHAEGFYTIASGDYQHVQGQFNISSSDVGAFIIGNGDIYNRSNLVFASGSQFQVTGSVIATQGFTGSLQGTASYANQALTASYATTSSYLTLLQQQIILSGSLKLDPTQDPDPSGLDLDSTALFQSTSNTPLGYDLYIRQNGNLVKWKWVEGIMSSGLLYGGVVTYSGSDVFVSPGSGIIVEHNATSGSEIHPIITYVTWSSITQSVANIATQQVTYLYIDQNGALQQQSTRFTPQQYNNFIPLGAVGHFDFTQVSAFGGQVQTAYDQTSQISTFVDAFGPLKISGYGIIGQPGTLGISVGSGVSFIHGGFYENDPEFPSTITTSAQATASIAYVFRSGSGVRFDTNAGTLYDAVRPGWYDPGTGNTGSVSNNDWTIQRAYSDPKTGIVYIYYGQTIYPDFADALADLASDPFTEGDTFDFTTFIGFLVLKSNTTDITQTADNQIIPAGLFRGVGAGGSGGGGGADALDDLSDVSITSPVDGEALIYNAGIWQNGIPISASFASTASYVENAQTASYVQNAQTASYILNAVSSSYAATASYVTLAQTASYVILAQTASYVETAQTASYVLQAISSSFATTASYVLNAISSSFATTASYADQALSSSYALTASHLDNYIPPFPFTGSAIISGSLEVTGSLSVSDGTYLKLDTSTHTLYDQIGAQSVNWNIRSLRDSNGNSSLNWDSRVAQDLSTITSIDWENRALFDLNTTQSVNWGERFLIDTYFANSVDWENRQLIDSTGNVVLDWFNLPGTLYGTASWAESASRADSIPLAGLGFGEIQVNNGGVIGASNRIYIDLATSTLHTADGGILSATGSLLGTSSYADQALSSSYALTASYVANASSFPYTGSAIISGSLIVTGSVSATSFSGDGSGLTGITNPASTLFNYYNFI